MGLTHVEGRQRGELGTIKLVRGCRAGGVLQMVKMKNWVGRTYADARDNLGVFSLCRVKN